MSEQEDQEPRAPRKKKNSSRMTGIAVLVLVLLGAAGGGAWWWTARADAASSEGAPSPAAKPEAKPKPDGGGLVPLQPFLVNLADQDASRFLRCTLSLVVADEATATKITGGRGESVLTSRLRSAILELLTTQTADVLVTTEGKQKLKSAILAKANAVLGEGEATDVLFSEFVVQF